MIAGARGRVWFFFKGVTLAGQPKLGGKGMKMELDLGETGRRVNTAMNMPLPASHGNKALTSNRRRTLARAPTSSLSEKSSETAPLGLELSSM